MYNPSTGSARNTVLDPALHIGPRTRTRARSNPVDPHPALAPEPDTLFVLLKNLLSPCRSLQIEGACPIGGLLFSPNTNYLSSWNALLTHDFIARILFNKPIGAPNSTKRDWRGFWICLFNPMEPHDPCLNYSREVPFRLEKFEPLLLSSRGLNYTN